MAACYESAYDRGKLAKSRLLVLRKANGVMPTQCRQCDDGPCANVCPTGALRFDDSCIELHEEICIGCKLCTIACPYGAISSSAELMPSVNYASEPLYNLGIESQAGAKTIAVKCDMCYGSKNGPACIDVCPTSALIMINPSDQNGHKFGKKPDAKAVDKFFDKFLDLSMLPPKPEPEASKEQALATQSATPAEKAEPKASEPASTKIEAQNQGEANEQPAQKATKPSESEPKAEQSQAINLSASTSVPEPKAQTKPEKAQKADKKQTPAKGGAK